METMTLSVKEVLEIAGVIMGIVALIFKFNALSEDRKLVAEDNEAKEVESEQKRMLDSLALYREAEELARKRLTVAEEKVEKFRSRLDLLDEELFHCKKQLRELEK